MAAIDFLLDMLATVGVFLILTLSLNLDAGYCGIPNFGKVLAMIAGAFVVAFFPGRILASILGLSGDFVVDNASMIFQINNFLASDILISVALFIATIIVAVGFGMLVGYVSTRPAVKIGSGPLAIMLLAMGEGMRVIGINYAPLAGGSIGISAPDVFAWAGGDRFVVASVVLFAFSVAIFFYINRLTNAPLGRMLRAVRDNEIAAESLGINIVSVKLKTMMISSAIAAIAGALYAFYSGAVISTAYTRASWTFIPWAMMLLGGSANNVGVVGGVFTFVFLRKIIVMYKTELGPYLPFDVLWLELILYGVMVILILLYRPEGLIPEKRTKTLDLGTIKKLQKA
ncbi:MAG: branched-chain amino acid ABC transporter permease [Candidatus Hadarchaeum sp.]|uniref:branched-chain amino acid ABC transporter permease n=2 Tax=Candidatus Hadarchaeum sp. TaxID=2883567 RepID=UPI00317F99DB